MSSPARRLRDSAARLRANEQLFLICLATVILMSGQGVIAPVLAQYGRSFGVSTAVIGLSLTFFGLARLVLNIPLGLAADRYGRRLLLVGGPLVTTVGMVGSGLAPNIWVLLASRFVAGAGSAMYMTCAQIYLADIATPANRARYIAANQGALFIGISVGPAIGGIVAELFGLRAPFFTVALLTTAAGLHAYFRLPETKTEIPPVREEGAPSGRPLRRLAAMSDFRAVAVVCFAVFMARTAGQQTLMPLYADSELGMSPGQLGLVLALISFMSVLGLTPATVVADRFGRKWAIVPAGALAAVGLLIVAVSPNTVVFVVAAGLVYGAGMALVGPAPAAYAADIAPVDIRGVTLGAFRSVGDLGIVVGPPLLGLLADATSVSTALVAMAAIMASAVLLFGLTARETVQRDDPDVLVSQVESTGA